MNRKELYDFLELSNSLDTTSIDVDEAEYELLSFQESNQNYLEKLLRNYRNSLSSELKQFVVNNLIDILAKTSGEEHLKILLKLLIDDFRKNYLDFVDLLDKISLDQRVIDSTFVPLLYYISECCSTKTIFSDFNVYLSCLEVLCGLEGVKNQLENKSMWGLEANTFRKYAAFVYPNEGACFLDGFFEPFVYKKQKKDNPAENFYKKKPDELYDLRNAVSAKFEMLSRTLHGIILNLLTFSPALKKNFMEYLILILNSNRERSKMIFDYTKVMSDGFAYNMNLVLRLFCGNLISKHLVNMIAPEYAEELLTTSFSSLVFFSKIQFTNLSLVKFLEYNREIYYETDSLDSENRLMAEYKEILKSKSNALEAIIISEIMKDQEQIFFDFVTEYCLSTNYDFPDYFYLTYLQIHNCLKTINKNSSGMLLKVLEKILKKKNTFKSHVIDIIANKPEMLKFTIINQIIEYYNSLQKEDDRYSTRHTINLIITENRSFEKLKICQRNIKFVNFMMGDFEYMLSNALSSISEIKTFKKKIKKIEEEIKEKEKIVLGQFYNPTIDKEIKDLKKKMMETTSEKIREENRAKHGFIFVKECFRLLNHIIRANSDLLVVDELIGNFVNILNCNLKIIVGPKCYTLRIEDPAKYKFDAKDLLRQIILIYIQMNTPRFIEYVANEQMYYDIELFKNALELAENKYILNSAECKDLRRLISDLENVKITEIDYDECEFIDPLTYNPITDPVKLLTSNVTVDRSTYNLIMLNDGIDPFNRQPLDESKVVVDEEMKKKIEDSKYK